jgi:hypothetical protein
MYYAWLASPERKGVHLWRYKCCIVVHSVNKVKHGCGSF